MRPRMAVKSGALRLLVYKSVQYLFALEMLNDGKDGDRTKRNAWLVIFNVCYAFS